MSVDIMVICVAFGCKSDTRHRKSRKSKTAMAHKNKHKNIQLI